MKDKYRKYEKAMKYYQNGDINKALSECERVISEDLKNSGALNLKGLLLYLKGDLNGAETTWKINRDYNDDEICKGYLRGIQEDRKRERLYKIAISMINEIKISQALENLLQCSESDFNYINVHNALTVCYIKTVQYDKAKESISKVLSIDKNNKVALDNRKILKEFGMGEKSKINFIPIIFTVIIVFAGVIGYLGFKNFFSPKWDRNINKMEVKVPEVSKVKEEENLQSKENEKEKENQNKTTEKAIDINSLAKLIEAKDFVNLDSVIMGINKENLSINENVMYEKAMDLLKNEGTEFFYKKGVEYFKAKDFGNANSEFLLALKYSKGNYLRPHILYQLGVCAEKNNDAEKTIKYMTEYYDEFSDGDYAAEALYKLTILYSKQDLNTAKKYADIISKNFNNTIYFNSIIKEILTR